LKGIVIVKLKEYQGNKKARDRWRIQRELPHRYFYEWLISGVDIWPRSYINTMKLINNVTDLVKGGRNITHIQGFNEPDGPWSQGGSNMSVSSAVYSWMRETAPL
jgi:hypothetical protein